MAVVGLLLALAGGIVGFVLAYPSRYGQHSEHRSHYRVSEVAARCQRADTRSATDTEPPPQPPTADRAAAAMHNSWPAVDRDTI